MAFSLKSFRGLSKRRAPSRQQEASSTVSSIETTAIESDPCYLNSEQSDFRRLVRIMESYGSGNEFDVEVKMENNNNNDGNDDDDDVASCSCCCVVMTASGRNFSIFVEDSFIGIQARCLPGRIKLPHDKVQQLRADMIQVEYSNDNKDEATISQYFRSHLMFDDVIAFHRKIGKFVRKIIELEVGQHHQTSGRALSCHDDTGDDWTVPTC